MPAETCANCKLVHGVDGDPLDACIQAQRDAMQRLLKQLAFEVRPCKACGAQLYMVTHVNGKKAPYTVAGLNHFIDCPEAEQFARARKPRIEEP
jgi:hypothetical protein